jgi:integrase
MAHQAHLYKINDTFYFRVRIPKDLKEWFGKQDFKRSLRTKVLTSAKRLVILWAAKTEKLFTTIRAGLLAGIMNRKQIKKLIDEYIGYTLKNDDEERIAFGVQHTLHETPDGPLYITERAEFDPVVETIVDELKENRYDTVSRRLNEFLEAKGIEIEKESYDYKLLCRDIAFAHVDEIHEINVNRDMRNFSDPYYLKDASDVQPVNPSEPVRDVSGLLFSELVSKYLAEKQARDSCGQGTLDANQRYFDLFKELLGDCPIQCITRDQLVDCLNKMKRLPSRRDIKPEYKGKTVKELLELDSVPEPLGVQTIKNHISTLSSCFKWAVLNGHMVTNIAEGLTPKDNRSKRERRQPYTTDHLKALTENLSSRQKSKGKSPDRWLIPLVALFGGMRIEEICQLQKNDVKEIDGVWCFDVYQMGDNKVKTANSERIVPLHPQLIELGFLDYQKSLTHDQLWPNLKRVSGKYSHKWGQWFQSFNKRHVSEDGRFVFHSLRHNFVNGLKQQGVQEQVIAELAGHKRGSVTMETYGKEYEPRVLLEALRKLDYKIDFSSLKWTA